MQCRHKMKSHRPKGGMCASCRSVNQDCSGLAFHKMPAIGKDADGIVVVRCTEHARPTTEEAKGE